MAEDFMPEIDGEENEDPVIIQLADEDGNEADFEFVDTIRYLQREFVVLLPVDDEDNGIVILEIAEDENGEEEYITVDDQKLLMAVFEQFKELYKDSFDFE